MKKQPRLIDKVEKETIESRAKKEVLPDDARFAKRKPASKPKLNEIDKLIQQMEQKGGINRL